MGLQSEAYAKHEKNPCGIWRTEEAERIGLEKGLERGLEQGLEQGDLDRAIKVAREMLADGMSVDKIAKYTNLSIEEIEAL